MMFIVSIPSSESTVLESDTVKSTKGSVSLLPSVSFPSITWESVIVKSISPSLFSSTARESVTVKSTKGSVSLSTWVSLPSISCESVIVKSISSSI